MKNAAKGQHVARLDRLFLGAMVLVLLLSFALGAAQLNVDILWVDEMHSVSAFGASDPSQSIQAYLHALARNTYVPLYYIIGAGWAYFVGWSQVALRYSSLLLGALSVAFLYRFAADVFGRRAAWLAALLFASNAIIIIFFHELRNYSLWLLLSIVHLWQYWRLVDGAKADAVTWTSFIVTTAALLYTHPFSPFVLLGLGLHHLVLVAKERRWWQVTFAWGAGVLAFLPYVPLVLSGVAEATNSRSVMEESLSSLELIPILAHVLANGVDFLWAVVVVAAGWALWRKRSPAFLRLCLIFATVTISLLVFHALDPFVSTRRLRYFLVALTFAIPLAAQVLDMLPHSRIVVPLFLLLWMAGFYSIYQQAEHWKYAGHHSLLVAHPPLHRFADALQSKTRPYEAMLGFTQASFLNDSLRFGFSTVEYYSETVLGVHGAFIWTGLQGNELREEFSRRVGDYPHLIFVYEPHDLPANFNEVQVLLEEAYSPCEVVVDTEGIFAQRYNYHTLECDRQFRSIEYDNEIKVIDRFADYDRQKQSIRVVAGWEVANEQQLDEYNVSIQIISTDWQSLVQAPDRHLYDHIVPWYVVELSTADLPAGDYNVMVILYDRDTIKKVAGVDLASGLSSDVHSVFSFTIES